MFQVLGIGRLRKELVRQAQGDVLEVAAGLETLNPKNPKP